MINNIATPIYKDVSQPTDDRVRDLLARMTLDEKIAQLGSAWVYELLPLDEKADALLQHGIGHITRIGGASRLQPGETAALANRIQKHLLERTRLGIPALVHEECTSGYMARGAVCYPQSIGLASTWEPSLVQRMADAMRTQIRAAGAHQGLAPVLDVARDPRWGRVEETYGEDPYLIASIGVAFVEGLQGDNWDERVVATLKHFAGHGVPDGGMNWNPTHIPPRELREVFLLPFEAAVKEGGAFSVMNAYHEIDGIPCAASRALLTDILREEWGFKGVVVSDYSAIVELEKAHRVAGSKAESGSLALSAGIDVELPTTDCYGDPLRTALAEGLIREEDIDCSVSRLLQMKFELGLFDNPYVDEGAAAEVMQTAEERQLARELARKSIVLLKNEGGLLPLSTEIRSLAIIGPNAAVARHLLGDYAYPCHIEHLVDEQGQENELEPVDLAENLTGSMRSVLDAIKARVSANTRLYYAQGCEVNSPSRDGFDEAIRAAQQAEVALLFVGDKSGLTDSCTSGESRDRAEIDLPGVQQALVEAIVATGTPVVVVLINGRPLTIPWIAENVPAILEAWLPGEAGAEAISDVLFGDYNPGGKLPITFPRYVGQIPTYYYHKPSGGRSHWKGSYVSHTNKPLYSFGFGLSYTQFTLRDIRLSRRTMRAGESVEIEVTVENVGAVDGDEVVQLYVCDSLASVTRPVKELKGFKRVNVAAGEAQTVTLTLHANQLGFYNQQMEYVLEPGLITLMLGTSSEDIAFTETIEITGDVTPIHEKVFFSTVR